MIRIDEKQYIVLTKSSELSRSVMDEDGRIEDDMRVVLVEREK